MITGWRTDDVRASFVLGEALLDILYLFLDVVVVLLGVVPHEEVDYYVKEEPDEEDFCND